MRLTGNYHPFPMVIAQITSRLNQLQLEIVKAVMENNKKGNVVGSAQESGQIDLIDLLMQLWKGKATVLVCLVIAIILSVTYLATAKAKWISTAVVTQPDVGQVAGYVNTLLALYSPEQLEGASDSGSIVFPSLPNAQRNTFERFSTLAFVLSESKGIDVENIKNTRPPQQQSIYDLQPLQLTYAADSADEAQAMLTEFIDQLDRQVVTGLSEDLKVTIASRVRELNESLAVQEKVAQEQRKQYVTALNQALELAEQSGIRQPVSSPTNSISDDSLYLLGSDTLETLVQNEPGRPLALPGEYYKTREKLLTIESIQPDNAQMAAFHYVIKPAVSEQFNGAKKWLIAVLLSGIAGGMFGACIVLGRNAIRDYQSRG